MREKMYNVLKKIYGVVISIAFWGGLLPLVPYTIAIFIGGTTGETISVFLYENYYSFIVALASIAIIIGLIAMYVGGKESLSTKSLNVNKNDSNS